MINYERRASAMQCVLLSRLIGRSFSLSLSFVMTANRRLLVYLLSDFQQREENGKQKTNIDSHNSNLIIIIHQTSSANENRLLMISRLSSPQLSGWASECRIHLPSVLVLEARKIARLRLLN